MMILTLRLSVSKMQSNNHCNTSMISMNYFGQCLIFVMTILVMFFTPASGIGDNVSYIKETENASGISPDGLLENTVYSTTSQTGLNDTRDLCEHSLVSRNSCGTTSDAAETMDDTVANNVSVSSGTDDIYFVYLPFGVISIAGNIMIVIIMSRSDNRGRSTSLLFIMLAISDTCLTLNNMYYSALLGITIMEHRDLVFGIITNLIWKVNVNFWNYLLVVITIERVVSLAIPFKVKTICSKVHLSMVLIDIFVFVAVANIPLWLRDWPSAMMENLETVDLIIGFFIPFIIILVGGIYIIIKVKYGLLLRSKYNTSVTNIVLGTILAFIVTMLPRRIIYLLPTGTSDEDKVNFMIIVFQFLECLNTGVNFFVYILAGRKFREDFINLITRRKKKISSRPNSKMDNVSAKGSK